MTSATGGALYRLAVGHNVAARQKDLLFLARNTGQAMSARSRRLTYAAVGALIAVAVIPPARIVTAAYLILGGAGAWAGVERLRAERSDWPPESRWLSGKKVLAGTAAGLVITGLLLFVVPPRLVAFLVLAVCVPAVILSRPAPTLTFWRERVLVPALIHAGICKPVATNGKTPRTRRYGKPVHTAQGSRVDFELITDGKHGAPYEAFAAARHKLAAGLGVDETLIEISHPQGTPASRVRLFVALPRPNLPPNPSPLAEAERTEWAQPFRMGEDIHGNPVMIETDEHNILIAGQPGKGKTKTARPIITNYLLDPDCPIFALDGKGSARDYRDMWDLCDTFVRGTDEDAPAQLADMLEQVLELVRTRNSTDPLVKDPGVLLLLEEFQDVRAGADTKTLKRIDTAFERLVRLCRAVELTMVFITQRPSVDDLPGGIRDLIDLRFCHIVRNMANARMILGETPSVPLPTKIGEAILMTPNSEQSVRVDLIDNADWKRICSRARALRNAGTVPDLESAVVRILGEQGPLAAAHIFERLADDVRPNNTTQLGLRLTGMPNLLRQRTRNGHAWTLQPPREAAQPLRVVGGRARSDGHARGRYGRSNECRVERGAVS